MQSQLLTNQWFGKAVGFTAAFVFAPQGNTALSIGVIVGIACGHLFDLTAKRLSPQPSVAQKSDSEKVAMATSAPHTDFLFAALGRIAKQSGAVRRAHIRLAERYMDQLCLDAKGRTRAISLFNQGKQADYRLAELAKPCRGGGSTSQSMNLLALQYMSALAAIDPSDEALTATVQLAGLLNIPPSAVAQEFGRALKPKSYFSNNTKGRQQRPPEPAQDLTSAERRKAFDTLGINASASRQQIKTAYRRLVNQHHPDKLGPTATSRAVTAAETRMVELREAFELLSGKG